MPKRESDLVDVELHLHWETDKAWRLSNDGDNDSAEWLPKSQAERDGEGIVSTYTMPRWFAEEKGFV